MQGKKKLYLLEAMMISMLIPNDHKKERAYLKSDAHEHKMNICKTVMKAWLIFYSFASEIKHLQP